ncbi:MAG TPA: MoaD/ThiS family protein [Ktedonobacterales bacterium]
MRVGVTLSGAVRVVVGRAEVEVTLDTPSATVAQAIEALSARFPRARPYLQAPSGGVAPGVRVLLNETRIDGADALTAPLREGDRIALLMPVVGG